MDNCNDNRDKMILFSFFMTLLIVIYHLAPHLINLMPNDENYLYLNNFFDTFGSIALNYFFAASAYKFYISLKPIKMKLKKRIITLIIPYIVWNTIYIFIYIMQHNDINLKSIFLGYTLTPFDGPLWYIFLLYIFFVSISFFEYKGFVFSKSRTLYLCVTLAIIAAFFHDMTIKSLLNFPYLWWLERALRMLPPFLFGIYLSKKDVTRSYKFDNHNVKIFQIFFILCSVILAIYLGDSFITTLLLYSITFLIWKLIPNIKLKKKSILRMNVFTVYAVHEGIIILLISILNKMSISFENGIFLIISIFSIIMTIYILCFFLNKFIRICPPIVDNILTGGRNR